MDSGDVGDIDFLKVGHEGCSKVALFTENCRSLKPEVAIASAERIIVKVILNRKW